MSSLLSICHIFIGIVSSICKNAPLSSKDEMMTLEPGLSIVRSQTVNRWVSTFRSQRYSFWSLIDNLSSSHPKTCFAAFLQISSKGNTYSKIYIESKIIWQYLKSDLPLHCRRTLDQFGYPTLRNTAVRDADQVLYKRTKVDKDTPLPQENTSKNRKHLGQGIGRQSSIAGAHDDIIAKVLMVDQLWLWVLDGGKCSIISSTDPLSDNWLTSCLVVDLDTDGLRNGRNIHGPQGKRG